MTEALGTDPRHQQDATAYFSRYGTFAAATQRWWLGSSPRCGTSSRRGAPESAQAIVGIAMAHRRAHGPHGGGLLLVDPLAGAAARLAAPMWVAWSVALSRT